MKNNLDSSNQLYMSKLNSPESANYDSNRKISSSSILTPMGNTFRWSPPRIITDNYNDNACDLWNQHNPRNRDDKDAKG